jgi:FtsH-binding integral membrane protein
MSSQRPEPIQRARFGTATGELAGTLLGKVFGLLSFSLAFAAVGGLVGAQLGPAIFLPAIIVEFGLLFAVQGFREREGLNFVLLYAFAFVSGLTLGPIVAAYLSVGLGSVVLQAAGITGLMTVGLSAYALTTRRDLSGLQPFLFMGLLGLVGAMLVNLFTGGTALSTVISWGGALLFSVLLVFQVNRIRYMENTMGNAVVITLSIYLDIVNLFMFVLRILGQGRR